MEACALNNLLCYYTKSDVSLKVKGKMLWFSFLNPRKGRSTCLQMFFKIGVLKNFANFARKHLCWSFFLVKLQALFNKVSCEISQIFKNTFFNKTPLVAASGRVCEETSLVKILQSHASERFPLRKIMNNGDCWNVYRFSCIFYSPGNRKIIFFI